MTKILSAKEANDITSKYIGLRYIEDEIIDAAINRKFSCGISVRNIPVEEKIIPDIIRELKFLGYEVEETKLLSSIFIHWFDRSAK